MSTFQIIEKGVRFCLSCNEKRDHHFDDHCKMDKGNGQCSISTHAVRLQVDQPCTGGEITYFSDVTKNHNKAQIEVLSETLPPCIMTVIIETRDGLRIVEEIPILVPEATNNAVRFFQVENLRRVAVRCSGGIGNCTGSLMITKTFCICCNKKGQDDDDFDDWVDYSNDCGNIHDQKNIERCDQSFIDRFSGNIFFTQNCDGLKTTYFRDFTDNHNKIFISFEQFTNCTATLIVTTKKGEVIRRQIIGNTARFFQLEDVREIAVECHGNLGERCAGLLSFANTFCICCKGGCGNV